MSGDTIVVGAENRSCAAGIYCGSAYVFRFDGTSWVEEQVLTASDANDSDAFGHSVSVSGDTIVVGTTQHDCAAGGNRCGATYVFRFDGNSWVEEQTLSESDASVKDLRGQSVSVSRETIAVGAMWDDCEAGDWCGSVFVYRLKGASWVAEQKLTASGARQDDFFGFLRLGQRKHDRRGRVSR